MMINQQLLIHLLKNPLEQLINVSQRMEKSELPEFSALTVNEDKDIVGTNLCNAQNEIFNQVTKNQQIEDNHTIDSVHESNNASTISKVRTGSHRESRARSQRESRARSQRESRARSQRESKKKSQRESRTKNIIPPEPCCTQKRKNFMTHSLKKEIDMLEFYKDQITSTINAEALIEMESSMQRLNDSIDCLGSKINTLQRFCLKPEKDKQVEPGDVKQIISNYSETIHDCMQSVRKFSYHSWVIAGEEAFETSLFKELNSRNRAREKYLTGKRIIRIGDVSRSYNLSTEVMSLTINGTNIEVKGKGTLACDIDNEDKTHNSGLESNHNFMEKKPPVRPRTSNYVGGNELEVIEEEVQLSDVSHARTLGSSQSLDHDTTLIQAVNSTYMNSNNSNGEEPHFCLRRKTSILEFSQPRKSFEKRLANMQYYKISNDTESCSDDPQMPETPQQVSKDVKRNPLSKSRINSFRQRQTNIHHPRGNHRIATPATVRKVKLTEQCPSNGDLLPTSVDGDRPKEGGDDDARLFSWRSAKEEIGSEFMDWERSLHDSDSDTFYSCDGFSSDVSSLSRVESPADGHDNSHVLIPKVQEKRSVVKMRTMSNWSQTRASRKKLYSHKGGESTAGVHWDKGGDFEPKHEMKWKFSGIGNKATSQQRNDSERPFEAKGISLGTELVETMGKRLDETIRDVSLLATAYLSICQRLDKLEQQRREESSLTVLTKESKSRHNTQKKTHSIKDVILSQPTATVNTETINEPRKRRFFRFSK